MLKEIRLMLDIVFHSKLLEENYQLKGDCIDLMELNTQLMEQNTQLMDEKIELLKELSIINDELCKADLYNHN